MTVENESCSSGAHVQTWIFDEDCFPVSSGPDKLPTKASARYLRDWATKGFKNSRGLFVFLDSCKEGQDIWTSVEAWKRFCAGCGGAEPEGKDG